ncbi:MAG: glycine oxidase ThiO [Acidimicrobiales bacterium]
MARTVLFVGGGVIGLASAWRAAANGWGVTVVDPAPGRGASWAAAGMLAPLGEAEYGESDLTRLRIVGAEDWPGFVAELASASDMDVGFSSSGSVLVAADTSDRLLVDDLLALHQRLGYPATRLSASACRSLVPSLAPGIRGGAELPDDHQVDNRKLVAALLAACERTGVTLIEERVTWVTTRESGGVRVVQGVRLSDGRSVPADVVVLAAGAYCGGIGGIGGVPSATLPDVRPVMGQVLRLRSTTGSVSVSRTVRGIVHGRPCYLVPRRDGSIVVGATSEERGFDTTVRAGSVHALLDDARTLVPGIDELELVECLAGLRPGSPDNGPFVGWTGVRGLAVATGHYRNGILLTPITARAVECLLAGDSLPQALIPFGLRRDRSPGHDQPSKSQDESWPGERQSGSR